MGHKTLIETQVILQAEKMAQIILWMDETNNPTSQTQIQRNKKLLKLTQRHFSFFQFFDGHLPSNKDLKLQAIFLKTESSVPPSPGWKNFW